MPGRTGLAGSSVRRLLSVCVPLGIAVAGVLSFHTSSASTSDKETNETPLVSLFTQTTPAQNQVGLSLQDDGRKVMGWISGTQDSSGKKVSVKLQGKAEKIAVGSDSTFTWSYKVDKPTPAEFSFGSHKQTLELTPLPANRSTVFFVVERTLYRPSQALNFAGFLRKLDGAGDFTPLTNQSVEVQLVSERKKATAARLKLTSDALGKITGSYTFQDADPLDNYTLSIPNYLGKATVLLGEYRKSKVKLKIDGTIEKDKLKFTFAALDYLDKPVAAGKASFTAQVVKESVKKKDRPLKPAEFVDYEPPPSTSFDLEELSEDDRLRWELDRNYIPKLDASNSTIVSHIAGDLELKGKKPGEHTIDLKKDWLQGGHAVKVDGVITDENGREQRATYTIPLVQKKLHLELAKRIFAVDEKIELKGGPRDTAGNTLKAKTTLVAMKLALASPPLSASTTDSPQPPSTPILVPTYSYGNPYSSVGNPYGYGTMSPAYPGSMYPGSLYPTYPGISIGTYVTPTYAPALRQWQSPSTIAPFKETLATATAFENGTAAIKLTEPGSYKLIAIANLEDGTTVRQEVGCFVKNADDLPGLILKLDKDDWTSGEKLTGSIHSRFADARVLLTIRDSGGVRFAQPIQLKQGVARLDVKLPQGLRYGCIVDVEYRQKDQLYIADKFIYVLPVDRMLAVQTKVKETWAPGEKAKIDFQVNHKEPVDLIVSVYDQSLLGISADKSVDIRNFYLADERAKYGADRWLVRREAAGQIVKQRQPSYAIPPHYAPLLNNGSLPGQPYGLLPGSGPNPNVVNNFRQFNSQTGMGFSPGTVPIVLSFGGMGGGGMAGGGLSQQYSQMFGLPSSTASASLSYAEGQTFVAHMPTGKGLLPIEDELGSMMIRRDFSDAALWNSKLRTDVTGKASVEFQLPDSITNWQVVVTAVSKDMHVGHEKSQFRTFKPIMVWPMLPRMFTEGDTIDLFASVHNGTNEKQTIKVVLKAENAEVVKCYESSSKNETTITVPARSNAPVYWQVKPCQAGFLQLIMSAECAAGSDASLKRLPVVRNAAEQVITKSGLCKNEAVFEVPKGADLNSSSLEVAYVPSLTADMADTLNYLVEYPYGCVEQTMSRFLPAIKVSQILKQYQVDHPELNKKLPGCVAGGIKRLLDLQQPDGGWGWQGNSQTHEMMTPYALYGLLQAEKAGYTIPSGRAIQRGLVRLQQFISAMGEAQATDRVYCMYVYSHRCEMNDDWWIFIRDQLEKKKLSDYALALALEMTVQKDKQPLAKKLRDALHQRAQTTGSKTWWQTARFSHWPDDKFEITAAVMKALVAYDKDDPLIDNILGFFTATKRGNRWNSTKDTAMILFAMSDYLAKHTQTNETSNHLTFTVNGGEKQQVAFKDGLTHKVTIPGAKLKAGENKLAFQTKAAGFMYRLVFRYWQTGKVIKPLDRGIQVQRRLFLLDAKGGRKEIKSGDAVPRGAHLESEVTATNSGNASMSYVLVENPKPSCCEVLPVEDNRFNQDSTKHVLREDRTAAVFWHHEQTPATIVDRCVLLAELAGEYHLPPVQVEMMYQTETRGHSGPFVLKVTAK